MKKFLKEFKDFAIKGNFLDIFYMYHLYGTDGPNGSRHLLGVGYSFVF